MNSVRLLTLGVPATHEKSAGCFSEFSPLGIKVWAAKQSLIEVSNFTSIFILDVILVVIGKFNVVKMSDGIEDTVLDIYENGNVFLIEICDDFGQTIDLPFVKLEDITEITYKAKQ